MERNRLESKRRTGPCAAARDPASRPGSRSKATPNWRPTSEEVDCCIASGKGPPDRSSARDLRSRAACEPSVQRTSQPSSAQIASTAVAMAGLLGHSSSSRKPMHTGCGGAPTAGRTAGAPITSMLRRAAINLRRYATPPQAGAALASWAAPANSGRRAGRRPGVVLALALTAGNTRRDVQLEILRMVLEISASPAHPPPRATHAQAASSASVQDSAHASLVAGWLPACNRHCK